MCQPRLIGFSIKSLSNEIIRFFDRKFACSGDVTGMQHGFINYIGCRAEPVYQRDIEKEFNVRRSTATGTLQLMEKNGLITREAVHGDARLKKLVLTERAIEIHRNARREMQEIETIMRAGLTEQELDVFFGVLDKIRENISREK